MEALWFSDRNIRFKGGPSQCLVAICSLMTLGEFQPRIEPVLHIKRPCFFSFENSVLAYLLCNIVQA